MVLSSLFAVITAMSILTGAARFLHRRRQHRFQRGWLIVLFSDVATSLSAGYMTYFFGQWQAYPPSLICFLSLIVASNGDEFIKLAQEKLAVKLKDPSDDK
jgi:hypothetical protein